MPPTSANVRPPASASDTAIDRPMSTNVATGRVSGAMPSISAGRSRESLGIRRLRSFGRGSAPGSSRSSLGARLRTRWPQYGHSVTYGLTSDPQFLHTTKRSG